jgi:hypothetical protein
MVHSDSDCELTDSEQLFFGKLGGKGWTATLINFTSTNLW